MWTENGCIKQLSREAPTGTKPALFTRRVWGDRLG